MVWLGFFFSLLPPTPRSIYLTAGKRGSLQRWQLGSWQGCGYDHRSGHAGGSSWRPPTPAAGCCSGLALGARRSGCWEGTCPHLLSASLSLSTLLSVCLSVCCSAGSTARASGFPALSSQSCRWHCRSARDPGGSGSVCPSPGPTSNAGSR